VFLQSFKSYAYVPSLKPSQNICIVLHGRGDDLSSFKKIHKEVNFTHMNYLLVNAPKAYLNGYTWYAYAPNQAKGILQNRFLLQDLVFELQQMGFKEKNIFMMGHSQGGLMSIDFALHSGMRLGGIVAMSTYVFFHPLWMSSMNTFARHIPMFISHGTQDDLLPFEDTKKQVEILKGIGLPVSWYEYEKDHFLIKEELLQVGRWFADQTGKSLKSKFRFLLGSR
jgi:phospholipase/carboxylesterase